MIDNIGEKIQELRNAKGLTLAELGLKVNLSASHLSQIENNKTSPSLVSLLDIARALDVELRYFFESQPEDVFVHRAQRGKPLVPARKKIEWVPLTPARKEKLLEVWTVTIQPKTPWERIAQFAGEYFCFLLSGSLVVRTRDDLIQLNQGDSIHLDGLQDSSWENPGDVPAVCICGKAGSTENH